MKKLEYDISKRKSVHTWILGRLQLSAWGLELTDQEYKIIYVEEAIISELYEKETRTRIVEK